MSANSRFESLERVCEALERRGLRLEDAAIWHIGRVVAGELARAHATTDEEGLPAPRLHLRLGLGQIRIGERGEVEVLWPAGSEEVDRPEQMAPEQRAGGRVTHRADVYRFGLLLWSLFTGRSSPPITQVNSAKLQTLSALRPDLPGELAAAIDAALEPSAARRTITCVELEQWLEPMDQGDAGRQMLAGALRLLEEEVPEEKEVPPDVAEEEAPPSSPFAAPAPLPAARPDTGSRRLSTLQSIGVAALTATLVFAVGTYIGDRVLRGPEPSLSVPAESP